MAPVKERCLCYCQQHARAVHGMVKETKSDTSPVLRLNRAGALDSLFTHSLLVTVIG